MKKIRGNVFETNSSSTHSLVLSDTGSLLDSPFPASVLESGVVEIDPGEYGWEIQSYSGVMDKLSYLYTDAMRSADKEDNPDPKANNKLRMIVDAVKNHSGCRVKFNKDSDDWHAFGYIDHQSAGLCGEVWEKGVAGVMQFVFNPKSYFETDNDNH